MGAMEKNGQMGDLSKMMANMGGLKKKFKKR